jgi:serine/threonine-protein kinase HipA
MGALEYLPATREIPTEDKRLEVDALVELAALAFASKQSLDAHLADAGGEEAMLDILSIGTSAGGARAKAVIAFDPRSSEVRSGQLDLPTGFEHWLIKFDGVEFSGDWGVADPAGYGLLEYAYYLIARDCGIEMMESRLLTEHGRNHFMTRRFDRDEDGGKRFVQSFAALAHFDYWESGQYSYEQLFMTMRELGLPQTALDEQFRRAVFNVVGCNHDDHVKNFSFVMDRQGSWDLAPAYDMCHAEGSMFTRFHQLSINGKVIGFDIADLKHLAEYAGLPRGREKRVVERTLDAFSHWSRLADDLGIPQALVAHVNRTLRLDW